MKRHKESKLPEDWQYASEFELEYKKELRHLYKYVNGTYHHSFNGGKDWLRCTCNDTDDRGCGGEHMKAICPIEIEFNKEKE